MKPAFAIFTSLLLLSFIATTAHATSKIFGKVVGVRDGDTITVLTPMHEQLKVRLAEIDAPEKDQPFGQEAKKSLSDMVFGKDVSIVWDKTDKYKRTLGRVFVGDTDVNLQQVRNGAAWAYTQYLTDDRIKQAETEARNAKAGLWALQADQIMPPWEWRHGRKESTQDFAAAPPPATASGNQYSCVGKRYCRQMNSCGEARFYLTSCGVSSLDGDKDGMPCESLCR